MAGFYQNLWILLLSVIGVFGARPGDGYPKMDIHSMLMETRVTSRFARTFITTEIKNPSNISREAIFDIELPKTAFITNFSMTVDNVTTVGTVKEKAEAKMTYQKAVSKGQSAGLVQSTGRKMEHFKISVNVGPLAKATFKLTYEELLKRQLGNYELYLRVKPQGLVETFQINVDIIEPQGISFLKAVGTFISNELTEIVNINRTETKAHIEFKPTVTQQRTCPHCIETALDGDLLIKYDVKRENSAGKLQVVNGYFVHYFAPPSLQRIPKNVVFVIDRSGSMHGNKIRQTYDAFIKILEDVPNEDTFTILTFDDAVEVWNNQLVKALPENIKKAKEFVSTITARGGTDINKALLTAVKLLTKGNLNNILPLPKVSASIIIFLSDGEPTSGTTDHEKIIDNIKRSLKGQASLYCLGFGNDVDYNFLEKLSLQNGGLARRIYEDSDSALQLQGFYNEVAYPMLLDVHLQYLDNSVDYLTQNSFKHYYQGSEIIVAGCITNNSLEALTAEVKAQGLSEPFSVQLKTNVNAEEEVEKEQLYIFRDFIERLWAYLTIEQLMSKQITLEGEERRNVTNEALSLSLKYNFVTPLTSMVVTRAEEDTNKEMVANKPKEGDQKDFDFDNMPHGRPTSMQSIDSHYYVDYNSAYDYAEEEFPAVRLIKAPASKKDLILHHLPTMITTPEKVEDHLTPITAAPMKVCESIHVFLRKPKVPERICIEISQDDDSYSTLFYDASKGITLNSRLGGDRRFERFGLLNTKLGLRAEISLDKVLITQGSDMKTYNWNSSFELDGFLKKDGQKITVTIKDGATFTILRVAPLDRFSLSVEAHNSRTNQTSGVIGQLLNYEKTLFHSNTFGAGDQIFPLQSISNCDFTQYGQEDLDSCLYTSLEAKDLISAQSYTVPDIFTAP